jgi:hypothetical protein
VAHATAIAIVHVTPDLVANQGTHGCANNDRHRSILGLADLRAHHSADHAANNRAYGSAIATAAADAIVIGPIAATITAVDVVSPMPATIIVPLMTVVVRILALATIALVLIAITAMVTLLMLITLAMRRRPIGRIRERRRRERDGRTETQKNIERGSTNRHLRHHAFSSLPGESMQPRSIS